jgi:hypothetical protein
MDFERFIGSLKVRPPSVERAKKTSPPCEPPEKTISCQRIDTSLASPDVMCIRGSQEKMCGLRETLTGASNRLWPSGP